MVETETREPFKKCPDHSVVFLRYTENQEKIVCEKCGRVVDESPEKLESIILPLNYCSDCGNCKERTHDCGPTKHSLNNLPIFACNKVKSNDILFVSHGTIRGEGCFPTKIS